MTTMARYQPDRGKVFGILHHGKTVPADVLVLCLWSAFGPALTGLFFALGFGAEIGLAVMTSG